MVTRDISKYLNETYGIDVSTEMVSKITDKLIPSIEKLKTRTFEAIYYFVFLDTIHFSVREEINSKESILCCIKSGSRRRKRYINNLCRWFNRVYKLFILK